MGIYFFIMSFELAVAQATMKAFKKALSRRLEEAKAYGAAGMTDEAQERMREYEKMSQLGPEKWFESVTKKTQTQAAK